MDAEVSTHTFLTMIIEESVCFMSCEPIFVCNYSYVVHTEYIYIFFHQQQNNRKLMSLHNNDEDDKHAHGFADF
jgi:hypothetical protein